MTATSLLAKGRGELQNWQSWSWRHGTAVPNRLLPAKGHTKLPNSAGEAVLTAL